MTTEKKVKGFEDLGRLAAQAADDKKARDIRLLDVRPCSGVTDYVVLATADSSPQMGAIEDELDRRVDDSDAPRRLHRQGSPKADWLVLDFGGVMVHLMTEQVRQTYNLEELWSLAPGLDWREKKTRRVSKKSR